MNNKNLLKNPWWYTCKAQIKHINSQGECWVKIVEFTLISRHTFSYFCDQFQVFLRRKILEEYHTLEVRFYDEDLYCIEDVE